MKSKDTGKKDPKQTKKVTVAETAKKPDTTKRTVVPTKKTSSKNVAKPSTTTTTTTTTTKPKTSTTATTATTSKTTAKTITSKATSKPKPDLKKNTSRISIKKKTAVDPKKQVEKFKKLIDKKKLFSGITAVMQKRFNHWKALTLLQKQQVMEKSKKTIVTKKRLNIHRINTNRPSGKDVGKTTSSTTLPTEQDTLQTTQTISELPADKEEPPKPSSSALRKAFTTVEGSDVTPLKIEAAQEDLKLKKLKNITQSKIEANETIGLLRRYFGKWAKKKTHTFLRREARKSTIKKTKIYLVKERSKALLDEKEDEGKGDGLKKMMELPVRESISVTGTKTLMEKIVQKESKSSKHLGDIIPPKEGEEDKLKNILAKEMKPKGKTSGDDLIKKKGKVKSLILNISRNNLTKYFIFWKNKTTPEEMEQIRKGIKKTVIKKKVINLHKKTKDKDGKEVIEILDEKNLPKDINLEIPMCPISKTENYLKNVRNVSLIQYYPEELFSVPSREIILKNNLEVTMEGEPNKKRPVVKNNNLRIIILKILLINLDKGILIRYFNIWRHQKPLDEIEEIVKKSKKKVIKRTKLNLKRKGKDLEPEEEEEDDEKKILRGIVVQKPKPGEPTDEDRTHKGMVEILRKPVDSKKKKSVIKDLILNMPKTVLVKYFNIWKNAPDTEEMDEIRKGTKKTVIKKKVINLQKKPQDKGSKEEIEIVDEKNLPKDINLEIPMCPISKTENYLKNVRNVSLIQYYPDELYSIPVREPKLKTDMDITMDDEDEKGKRKPVVITDKNIRLVMLRNLFRTLARGLLIQYFNKWKFKSPNPELEEIVRKSKKKIIAKKKLNLKKIKDEPEEDEEEIVEEYEEPEEPGKPKRIIRKIIKRPKGKPEEEEIVEEIEEPDEKGKPKKIIRKIIKRPKGKPEEEEIVEEVEEPDEEAKRKKIVRKVLKRPKRLGPGEDEIIEEREEPGEKGKPNKIIRKIIRRPKGKGPDDEEVIEEVEEPEEPGKPRKIIRKVLKRPKGKGPEEDEIVEEVEEPGDEPGKPKRIIRKIIKRPKGKGPEEEEIVEEVEEPEEPGKPKKIIRKVLKRPKGKGPEEDEIVEEVEEPGEPGKPNRIIRKIIKRPKGKPEEEEIVEEVEEPDEEGKRKKIIRKVLKRPKGKEPDEDEIVEEIVEPDEQGKPKKIIRKIIRRPKGKPEEEEIVEEVEEPDETGKPKKVVKKVIKRPRGKPEEEEIEELDEQGKPKKVKKKIIKRPKGEEPEEEEIIEEKEVPGDKPGKPNKVLRKITKRPKGKPEDEDIVEEVEEPKETGKPKKILRKVLKRPKGLEPEEEEIIEEKEVPNDKPGKPNKVVRKIIKRPKGKPGEEDIVEEIEEPKETGKPKTILRKVIKRPKGVEPEEEEIIEEKEEPGEK